MERLGRHNQGKTTQNVLAHVARAKDAPTTAELTTISALAKPTVMPLPTTWRNYSSDQWTNRLCSSALNMKSAPAAMQGATRANRLQPITDWRNP